MLSYSLQSVRSVSSTSHCFSDDTQVKHSDTGSYRTWWIRPDSIGIYRIPWRRIPIRSYWESECIALSRIHLEFHWSQYFPTPNNFRSESCVKESNNFRRTPMKSLMDSDRNPMGSRRRIVRPGPAWVSLLSRAVRSGGAKRRRRLTANDILPITPYISM